MTMRSIDTRFWSDGWIRKLNPLDRYLLLYLLTNDKTNWSGIYELEIGMMAFECGVDERDLEKSMLPRLAPKVIYVDGWVYIPNWIKYHHSESGTLSPQQKEGIKKAWNKIPDRIRLKIKEIEGKGIPPLYPIGGVSPSSSAFTSSSISETEFRAVREEEEETPRKPDRRTKDKESVYALFSSKKEPWMYHKPQRESALRLFDRGLDKLRKGIAVMQEHETDQYCPQALTPYEYEAKLPKLNAYIKKNNL